MLTLIVQGEEFYDERTEEFTSVPDVTLVLEHSLVSVSKWESKFKKPFLDSSEKTIEETLAYVENMVLTKNYPPEVFSRLTEFHFNEINEYIASAESATTFSSSVNQKGRRNPEVITSELVYYWMTAFNIPFECEKWHLNRLFSLIQICGIKNSSEKKMSKSEIAARNRALNEQRKAQLNTSG